jgi:hypothetical protein
MIIVSQEKMMFYNFENIEAIGIGKPLENNDGKFPILIDTTSGNQYPIAEYGSEERAKEVLQAMLDIISLAAINNKTFEEATLLIDFKRITRFEMPER